MVWVADNFVHCSITNKQTYLIHSLLVLIATILAIARLVISLSVALQLLVSELDNNHANINIYPKNNIHTLVYNYIVYTVLRPL